MVELKANVATPLVFVILISPDGQGPMVFPVPVAFTVTSIPGNGVPSASSTVTVIVLIGRKIMPGNPIVMLAGSTWTVD
jgi:hypothetical protein